MSVSSVYRIITINLKMRKVAAKWIPHHLSDEQKACHKESQKICFIITKHRYSPDLSPPDFDLFPKLKKTLRGKRFATIKEASTEVTRVVRQLNSEGVLSGIKDFPKHWEAVIKRNWDYNKGL